MGYYTEFYCKLTLKEDTPELILNTINSIINDFDNFYETLTGEEVPMLSSVADTPKLPINHPFGNCTRWGFLLRGYCWGDKKAHKRGFNKETRELNIYTELKNYDDEISLFLQWIKDYIDYSKSMKIWEKGEEDSNKTNLLEL